MSRWNRHALLVIDLQNDFLNDVPDPERYRRSVERLLGYCRTEGIGIYHLRVRKEPDRSNWMPFEVLRGRAPCIRGTIGAETPRWGEACGDEPVIPKDTFDGFLGTDLDARLRDAGVGHLFVSGLVTSVCVLTTAIAAMQRGYLVTVVRDCVADAEPDHTETIGRYGGFVFSTAPSRELPDLHPLLEARLDALSETDR
jgi:nicotinamidase-related amidase